MVIPIRVNHEARQLAHINQIGKKLLDTTCNDALPCLAVIALSDEPGDFSLVSSNDASRTDVGLG